MYVLVLYISGTAMVAIRGFATREKAEEEGRKWHDKRLTGDYHVVEVF